METLDHIFMFLNMHFQKRLVICFLQIFFQIIAIERRRPLIIYISLEFIFYSSLVFIFLRKNLNECSQLSVSLFFIFKLVGRLVVLFSFLSPLFKKIFFYGLSFKLSLFPGFFWFPSFLEKLKVFRIWWFTGISKITYFFFLITYKEGGFSSLQWIILMLFLKIFLFISISKWKIFLGFSTLIDRIKIILVCQNSRIIFLRFYLVTYILLLYNVCFSFKSKKTVNQKVNLLFLSGFPPSPLFFFKVFSLYLFRGRGSFFYLLIFVFVLQASAYFFFVRKFFSKIN